MTIETGTPKNDHELAVVHLTDRVAEETGRHMIHSHVEVAVEGMQIQAVQILLMGMEM